MSTISSRLRRPLRGASSDRGFSLVEATIALFISVLLFIMLGRMLFSSLEVSRNNRILQQATDLGNEAVELSRALPWAELAMDAQQAGDPRVAAGKLKATAVDLPSDEELVCKTGCPVASAQASVQSKYVETIDDQGFEVYQYVTEVQPDLRRVVVVIRWTGHGTGGATHEHHTSALVAKARLSSP